MIPYKHWHPSKREMVPADKLLGWPSDTAALPEGYRLYISPAGWHNNQDGRQLNPSQYVITRPRRSWLRRLLRK